MKNLKFKYFSAKNFVCFGPEGIEIDLTKKGNVILVRGENLDVIDEEEKEGDERVASNGIGKSTIPDILVYGLFGKPLKHPSKIKHEDVINNRIRKDMRIEVRWDDYRVVRQRSPNKLRFWQSSNEDWNKDTELTLGGMPDTQNLIEQHLGLNYETFLNLMVFADQGHCTFLECTNPQKRTVVEDLMALQVFRIYSDVAKEEKNNLKNKIKLLASEYEHSIYELKSARERIDEINQEEKSWRDGRNKELIALQNVRSSKQSLLESSDIGAALAKYENAQKTIQETNDKIVDLDAKIAEIRTQLPQVEEKVNSRKQERGQLDQQILVLRNKIITANNEIKSKEKILKVKDRKGQVCSECFSVVDEANYLTFVDNAQKSVDENEKLIAENNVVLEQLNKELAEIKEKITKGTNLIATKQAQERQLSSSIDNSRKEIQKLTAIQKPTANDQEQVLLTEITEIDKQIVDKTQQINGPSPYVSLHTSAEEDAKKKETESEVKKAELQKVESLLPYYEWWADGFGPKGIPKFAINHIISPLNTQIAHWLEFLINGKIKLLFNNELEESIERNPSDGDPFVYYQMSGGEKRRLNLAVSQAFAYIMSHSSKASPSVVFLDEVTTNIDPMGVVGVYNMIIELAKDKQVFVTTHDQGLQELLQGCETLYLRKKDGFTTVINKN
ncbi:MAG: AAA family ATPase [Proteobacteria bacterium]|jgi:DNA repair exonuclease SbcCD ATPase subunit|nr:AAA family ATPase [Pseudomonadota bacterium]